MDDLFEEDGAEALYPDDAAHSVILEEDIEAFEDALNEFVDDHGCYDIKYSTSRRETSGSNPPDAYVYHAALVIYPDAEEEI